MKNWLEKQFRLSEFNTNIKTELLAGLTTFVTMAYVLATIPNILAGAGYDKHTTLTAMIILIIVTSCAMALVTNRPFALAPGLGSVGIIASMITNEGVSMPIAAGVIFWSGVLFIIISFFGLREAVVRVIPVSLKQAVSAGIGLFIALLGAKNCGLIVANDAKNCLSFWRSCISICDRSSDRISDPSGDQGTKYTGWYDSCDPADHSGRNSFRCYTCSGIHFCISGRYRPSVPES